MTAGQAWDAIWVTAFPLTLVGGSVALLPQRPAVQVAFVPIWVCYWLLTRGTVLGAWVALWCGILLECIWGVPPGGGALFLLLVWRVIRLARPRLPEPNAVAPLHGLLLGTVLAPLFCLWLWLYASAWQGPVGSIGLAPTLPALIAAPAAGAIGGCIVFALARLCDFRALRPSEKEVIGDEG